MPFEEDFALILSIVLLCSLSLLWIFVIVLFLWLRRIHKRVEKAHKDWSVCSKLVLDVKQTEVENVTEIKNTYTFPLVIANKRVENSEASKSWKDINRTFAYAPVEHEESESQFDLEGVLAAAQTKDEREGDCTDSQGESTSRDLEDASPVSGAKIANDGPAILFLTGGSPDEDIGGRRIFKTLKGAQGNDEVCVKSMPKPKERIVLVEAKNFIRDKEEATCLSNGTVAEQRHRNDAGYFEAVSEFNKMEPASEMSVVLDKNRNQLTSKAVLEEEGFDAGEIVDGDELVSRNEQGGQVDVSGVPETSTLLPRRQGGAENLVSAEGKPKGKGKHRRKRPAERNPKDNCRTNTKQEKPLKKADDEGQGDLTAQHSKSKVSGNGGDKTRIRVPVNHGQTCENAENSSRGAVQVNHHDEDENSYDFITTPGNESHVKSDLDNKERSARDTCEDIYSNIDENNASSSEVSTVNSPGSIYVNFRNSGHVDENALIYSNADAVEQNSTSLYDNPAFVYDDEGPIYVNVKEMFDIQL